MTQPGISMERLDTPGVWLFTSEEQGDVDDAVTVMVGVHPDEDASLEVHEDILRDGLKFDKGSVIVALANLKAIENGKLHYVDYNMNRAFIVPGTPGVPAVPEDAYEYGRAQELMPYMERNEATGQTIKAGLDLHQHYEIAKPEFGKLEVPPFIIVNPQGTDTALRMGAPIIAYGFNKSEPGGTDYYFDFLGKEGICVEGGAHDPRSKDASVARQHAWLGRFLIAQGLRDDLGDMPPLFGNLPTRFVETDPSSVMLRTSEQDWLESSISTFDALHEGQLVGAIGGQEIRARAGQVAIFPDNGIPIGDEMISFARELDGPKRAA